jgi:LysR family transcriptional regulator, chromosome initiation inhibitor
MLDYASLTAVASVVREGSFERAARALKVTPSAVSQRVKLLEERLGCVLIVRAQPCRATATGEIVCRHVGQVSLLEQDLRTALPVLQSVSEERATLRVAVNADSLGTWFMTAIAPFLASSPALLDVVLDDEDHTLEWLRSGSVLAAVTANRRPVQGCNSVGLGPLRYHAVATPAFMRQHFPQGVSAAALSQAPCLRFNRKDLLQSQWMQRLCRREIEAPTHWLPSTQAFVDATLAGVGWSMNPAPLLERPLADGSLVELVPGRDLLVPLYWQVTRLAVPTLARLTEAVRAAARARLGSRTLGKSG